MRTLVLSCLLCGCLVQLASAQAAETPTASSAPGDEASTPVAGDTNRPPPSAAGGSGSQSLALQHYEAGREHYLAGRYREALEELRSALALDPKSPTLVYNVARVNEDLGNLDEAIYYYQRYLELLAPNEHAEREKAEKTVRRLQGAKEEIAEGRGSSGLMGFGPQPAPAPKPSFGRTDLLFWATAIGGAAGVVAGGVTGLLALQRENDVQHFVLGRDGSFKDRSHLSSQADAFALASDVSFVAGGALLAGAALLFFLRAPEDDTADESAQSARLRLDLDLHGRDPGLRLSARF